MQIGYLYDFEAYPPKGGNHRHAVELTQGFLGSGCSVSVVDDPTMPGVTNYGGNSADLQRFIKNIDVLYVRIDARFTLHWDTLTEVVKLAGNHPVVWEINSPSNEGLAYSWLGGSLVTAFGKENVVRRLRRHFHALRQLPGIYLEEHHRRRLAREVSSAICVSAAVGRYASKELGITNVLVLPNGGPLIGESEILQRRGRRERRGFTVLYTGSAMYPWQGLDYLARVIALAERESPELTFVLAVNQRTPNLPTSGNVVILENLNQEEVRDAICAADVCVALIPEWPWTKYGFHGSPTKLFEYMGFMAPVVSSNHGQMREIVSDGEDGLLCENDPREILNKLLFLRDNPERAADIGRRGWERIQSELNWQHNVKETLKIFEKSLGNTA